jgi:N-acetylmuramoyl-L-alanine amidase
MPRLRDITPCRSTTVASGLSHQVLAEMKIVVPDVLVDYSDLNISIGAGQFPFLQRRAKEALARALARRGRTLVIKSGYRTCIQQFLLFRWFNNGNPCDFDDVARPGRSNHESGLGMDVDDSAGWKPFLEREGWRRLEHDQVHFDFRGGGTPIGNVGIKAFQTLWNRNFPSQRISDDGVYGTETAEKLAISPSEGFNSGGVPRRVLRLISPLMQGGDVRLVQLKLKDRNLFEADVDGVYRETTEAAVRRFQEAQHLTVDGVVGNATYEALGIE